ncbi:MAG: dienelactone hydrolase family protein [Cyanobacteria bacterium P01_D01_bin.73]
MSLTATTIPPEDTENADGLVILLHGWGANSADLVSLSPMLDFGNCYFAFPDAPMPHPHNPQGLMWYYLEAEGYPGLEDSRDALKKWLPEITTELKVPLEKTILAGFSQGGAMTLDVGLELPLAGLVSLSGYLHHDPPKDLSSAPPVLIMHGTRDPIVPLQMAQMAKENLSKRGASVTYFDFPMDHSICPDEIFQLGKFIHDRLTVSTG